MNIHEAKTIVRRPEFDKSKKEPLATLIAAARLLADYSEAQDRELAALQQELDFGNLDVDEEDSQE